MPSSEYREGVGKTSSMFLNRAEMKTRKVKVVKDYIFLDRLKEFIKCKGMQVSDLPPNLIEEASR